MLYLIQKKKQMFCVVKIFVNILIKVNPFSDCCYPGIKTKLCVPNASENGRERLKIYMSNFKILA